MSLTYSATSMGVAAGNLGQLPYGSGSVGGLQLGSQVDKAFDVSGGDAPLRQRVGGARGNLATMQASWQACSPRRRVMPSLPLACRRS